MTTTLDVYKEWLGIPDGPRPPNHYELLRLVKFEDNTDKIRGNYKKLNGHVRKYASGQYSVRSQELLNELYDQLKRNSAKLIEIDRVLRAK